jgi:UTP--glucose-1-phosphate uridylyltransferase
MQRKVTKAVFPVAGLGTRFLPATKSIPKEIMTLVDRPLIQYAIDEAREAGITEFIFVTSRGKSALEDYFDHAPELEAALERRARPQASGRAARHQHGIGRHRLHPPAPAAGPRPRGLVRAPADRRRALRGDPARRRDRGRDALPAPDDRGPCRDRRLHGGGDGGAPGADPGLRHPRRGAGARGPSPVARVRGMVEKPAPGTAPSNLAVIGRYILTPAVLGHLDRMKSGAGGEIQLTDAIAEEIRRGARSTGCASRASASTAARRPASSRPPSPSASRARTWGRSSGRDSGTRRIANSSPAACAPLPELVPGFGRPTASVRDDACRREKQGGVHLANFRRPSAVG